MAERQAGLITPDVRASMKRLRRQGQHLVGQLRHDARRLVERTPVERVLAVADVGKLRRDVQKLVANTSVVRVLAVGDLGKLRTNLRQLARRAMREMEVRRARLRTAVQRQLDRVAPFAVQGLGLATRAQLEELTRRVGHIERRLEALADREKPGKNHAA